MKRSEKNRLTAVLTFTTGLLLVACADDNDSDGGELTRLSSPSSSNAEFTVSMINLTAAQPLSPPALIAHTEDYALFTLGESASPGLERVAEAGDNTLLLDEARSSDAVLSIQTGGSVLPPGASETFTLEVDTANAASLRLSALAMLVNTNDAIAALNSVPIADLEVGESLQLSAIAYDAGTEANDERAGTIPGPADGGAGFDAARDDRIDRVLMHSGVVTADDGLAGSVLGEVHRWDNPVTRVTITRTR